TEEHHFVVGEFASALVACVQRWREAKRGENSPDCADRGCARSIAGRSRDAIEGSGSSLEKFGIAVVLRKPQQHLGERRRSGESREVAPDVASRADHVEG